MDFNQKQSPPGLARTRTLVQAGFGLFCLWAGFRFYGFYPWALERSDTYVPRPPSVEAFLPISALLALKRLVLTGLWDRVHPAGLVSNLLEKAGRGVRPPLTRYR